MITKEQLDKWIDTEIGALRYYGLRADRETLTEESNLYDHLRSIGYTKKVIPLHRRCAETTITSNKTITKDTKLEDMYEIHSWDRDNKYSPLEIYWMICPEKRKHIIWLLTKGQYE